MFHFLRPKYGEEQGRINLWVEKEHGYTVKTKHTFLGNATPILGEKLKGLYVFWLFIKIGFFSATWFKRSRRELSIDVAEHKSMLESKGVVRILVIFQARPVFNHIIQKVSARAFHRCCWTYVYLEK